MASETHDDKKPRLLPTPNDDFYQITACLAPRNAPSYIYTLIVGRAITGFSAFV